MNCVHGRVDEGDVKYSLMLVLEGLISYSKNDTYVLWNCTTIKTVLGEFYMTQKCSQVDLYLVKWKKR